MEDSLFEAVRKLSSALGNWEEILYAQHDISPGVRGLLEELRREGGTSVPALARRRDVSRQHIQQQVDTLRDRGLVQGSPNPAHKRSPLISLTDSGRAAVENMRAAEAHALRQLRPGTSDEAVRDATLVVQAWARALRDDTQSRQDSSS